MTDLAAARARLAQFVAGPTPYVAYRGAPPPGTPTLADDITTAVDAIVEFGEAARCWKLVERLRQTEGAAVTICCDNPDFGAPNVALEVCADWTNWEVARFPGETVIDCLRDACRAAGIPTE